MTQGDTGPLVGLIDADDANHRRCIEALPCLSAPLIVTWPCLTEAMFLLRRAGGYPAQEAIWKLFERGAARLHPAGEDERVRARALMAIYSDTPMDLADASVVAAAEALGMTQVFTLDRHFYAYRVHNRTPFTVVP